ncbi:hypothetical protein BGZ68_010569 [Mortierella alpina]|nr:hypothetical protein BGZ68_010569 [Mortierella alpina]
MHSFIPATPLVEDERAHDQVYYTSDSDSLDSRSSSVSDAYESSKEDLGCEEFLYDHYDIQLKPRQTHMSKDSNPKRRSETKIIQPLLRTSRRQYIFPTEVLDLVCSHLSQAALRCAVSLVCREWRNASKRHIRRSGAWENAATDEENRLLEHMPILSTLECYFGIHVVGNIAYDWLLLTESLRASWDKFRTAITTPFSASHRDQHTDSAGPICLLHHIRRLVFRGPQMTYEVSIPQILGQFQFLQSLDLHVTSSHIPLFQLLENSPSLRELKVASQYYLIAQVNAGDDEDLIPETPASTIYPRTADSSRKDPLIDNPKAYLDRYKLQVFDLDRIAVRQRVLERVIATCPELRVLKLHEINENIWILPSLSLKKYRPIDEERLWNHLQSCCPKIEWYHISLTVTRPGIDGMEALRRMCQNRTLGRFLTTLCTLKWHDCLQDSNVRRVLRHVTVLEVLPQGVFHKNTECLQQLLCHMPNLLHLIASDVVFKEADTLVIPGCARPDSLCKKFNDHNRGRKRQERKERRQQRQKALERFHVPTQDRMITAPEVWQCRDLRTMSMNFGHSMDNFHLFTQYIRGHRLLRNLTSLSLGISELRVGQVKEKPTAARPRPERWVNDFLLLRGLRCLEALDIKTHSIPGVVRATDFEFLRKQDSSKVIFIIPTKNRDAGSDLDEDSTRSRHGRRKNRPFWPHLQSIHMKYNSVQAETDFADLVVCIEQIRPGVEFVIKHSSLAWGTAF